MNFKFEVNGGGLFSRLLQCAIIPLVEVEFDKVYLTAYPLPDLDFVDHHVKPGIKLVHETVRLLKEHDVIDPWDNIFNFFLDQELDNSFIEGGLLPVGRFYNHQLPIESSGYFSRYKEIVSKLKFKQYIQNDSKTVLHNYHDVLGVHVRLKDANSVDDPKTFQSYVDAIHHNLNNYRYSKIFVSADNIKSIHKLQEIFDDMIIFNDLNRSDNELADSFIWEHSNYFRKFYWVDALIDCLSLSQCHSLICKNSNYANAAILFGNFQFIDRI